MAPSDSSNSSPDPIEIDRTLEFLTKGKEKIQLDERYRNVTLVLGVTGSGKSTFVQWLAGDNTKLISERVPGTRNDFIIKDDSRISNSTTQSMTIYPELVVDQQTYNAYYDCPGFSDTRNASVDIAGTYFIKSVADYVESARLIFVVGHDAVKVGNDRIAFPTLLKHSTNLVKNVDKFRNSIALVVTKVANIPYEDENGKLAYESDAETIDAIANFITNVKNELKENSPKANANSIKFIDALLQKDGSNYSKIAIFRKPNMPGPLSDIPLLQEGKVKLLEMIKQLELTPTEESDFGYSISGDSKKTVLELANVLNNRVWSEAETIAKVVASTTTNIHNNISLKVNSFGTSTATSVEANLPEAQAFSARLKAADRIASELSNVSNVTTKVFAEKLNYTLNALEIDTLRDNVEQIALDAKHLEFFQNVTDSRLVTKPWESLLSEIVTSLSSTKQTIQTEINSTVGALTTTVQSTISGIASDLLKAKLSQMQSMDVQTLQAQLEREVATLRNQTELQPNSIEQLATAISKNVESLGLETQLIQSNTLTLFNSAKYLTYLQAISDQPLNIWSPEWISPLVPTVKSLYEFLDWYRFLNGLYSKLGEYQFQQDTTRYNVANLEDWGEGQTRKQDIQIRENNFKMFLNKVSQYEISGLDAIRDAQVAQWQLNELNQVLSLTLKHEKLNTDCLSDRLTITGDYVKLSDLKPKLVDMCPNSVSVNIFASNTVFIDGDLNGVGDMLKLTIMAPKWEVIGQRRINLNGSAGVLWNPPKANNSTRQGTETEIGKPGLPGGSAGSFIGVANLYVNRDGLTITANGGVGGDGQEGGDGAPGEDGKDAEMPSSDCNIHLSARVIEQHSYHPKFPSMYTCHYYTYYLDGKDGKKGDRGGDGGAGGLGGNKGNIELYNLDGSPMQKIETNDGTAGAAGQGGNGGKNGKHGRDMKAKCEDHYNLLGSTWTFQNHEYLHYTSQGVGESGTAGVNNAPITQPESASKFEHAANEINEYKKYLRNDLNGVNERFKRNTTIALLDQLDQTTAHIYDTVALAGELEGLEEQSHILKTFRNKNDSIHYYQSLSSRINTYAASPKTEEQSAQYRKVFNYLSAAAQGKLYNLKAGEETNLIIDVEGYLSYVQENMNILNQLQKEHNEHEVVKLHKEKYHKNIDQQINEATDFIENRIKPEFDKIGKDIDAKIDQLIEDTAKMIEKAKEKKSEIEKKQEELKSQIGLRVLFSVLGVASQALSFAGPHGAAIGAAVGGVSSLAEGFVLDDQTADGKEFKMPPGIKDNIKGAETEYKAFFSSNAKKLKTQLELVQAETRDVPEMSDFGEKLERIVRRVPTNVEASDYESTVEELRKDLNKALEEETIKKEKSDKKWSDRSETAFRRANNVIQMGSVGLDRYSKHRGDKHNMDVLDKELANIKDQIKDYEDYKKTIEKKISPDMHNMMNSFKDINSKLDNKSLVALDVQQWEAQGMLRDIKVGIKAFLKGQNVEAQVMRYFEKLDEAMSIIIKIYDRIQNFQQQQQLTDFIANVNSVTARDIKVDDPELARAVEKLEIVIRSNVVLQQFDSTVVALKQLVFPYARHYLEPMTLPSEISFNDTYIDAMVNNANGALDKMRSKLVENRTKITQVDKYSHNAAFDSTKPCLQAPFYVWPNDEHASTLSKLLSGESVILKADIRHSDPLMDAIRFRKIELNFKAKNAALQPEINQKLEKFMISAIHMGNSYYRYDRKYYVINNDAQDIKYSFAKVRGRPLDSNKVYDKIAAGNLMLSPYAMWQITLSTKNETVTFDQLAMYRDEIDLELVGQGSYTESKAANSDDLQMDQYYSEYVEEDNALIDVIAQHESQFYSMQAMQKKKCTQYMAIHKASNSIHRAENSTGTLSYMSRLGQTVSNYFGGSATTAPPSNHITHPRFEYTQQQNANTNTNSLSEASNSVDVHGNLLMSQLFVGLIAGKNNTITSESYQSPEQTHTLEVDRLAQRVLPALSESSATRFRSNQIHNSNTQWHRDWNATSRKHN